MYVCMYVCVYLKTSNPGMFTNKLKSIISKKLYRKYKKLPHLIKNGYYNTILKKIEDEYQNLAAIIMLKSLKILWITQNIFIAFYCSIERQVYTTASQSLRYSNVIRFFGNVVV